MKQFVVGFIFTKDEQHTLLIQKNRPEFQRGKYNGVGGGVQDGETPLQAMIRECREETGLHIEDWKPFCGLGIPAKQSQYNANVIVHFFCAFDDSIAQSQYANYCTSPSEPLKIFLTETVLQDPEQVPTLCNTRWLIMMALTDHSGYTIEEWLVPEKEATNVQS